MAKDKRFLTQAIHNKKICLKIDELKEFQDWVITTAFYSALHFVKYKIFPYTSPDDPSKIYKNLEEYKDDNPDLKNMGISNHAILNNLVSKELPKIYGDYKYLYDFSMKARYNFYKMKQEYCDFIIHELKKIENNCII
jgi:hypothetical protein